MKVTCVMVSSLNGKTTNGNDPTIHSWTSVEDQQYFSRLIEQAQVIIMGRNTYEQAKTFMQHRQGRLRIILTSHPAKYADQAIPDQLEFSSDSPSLLLTKLAQRGFTQALLVGGATTNTAFLKEHLIDELLLTLEPVLFESGTSLFAEEAMETKLKLLSMKKLNEKGTLLLKYTIV